ncbi:MAG TPA: type II CAAX endopeptidase family protein [Kofleriaceae bacterium]|nr:type II CAAX endopeptidase family protein [Kofleriaceae bacterium]
MPSPAPESQQLTPLEAMLAFATSITSILVLAPMLYRTLGLAAMAVTQVVCIAGPALAIALAQGRSLRAAAALLGIRRASAPAWLGAALLGISFWFVNLVTVAPIADRYLGGKELVRSLDESILNTGTPMWVTIVIIAGFPGVCEELLMRGAVARAFSGRVGTAGAVIASALLFGLMHLHPAQMLTTAAFGLVLGYTALVSGSVLPAILVHVMNNAVVLLVAGEISPSATAALRSHPVGFGIGAGFLSICGVLVVLLGRQPERADPRTKPS